MARVIVGSYMFRYPLGGMISWVMQYLKGLMDVGHEVFFIEKAAGENACYDPATNLSGDNIDYALKVCGSLLDESGMNARWCFVSNENEYYGMTRSALKDLFTSADVYIDMGAHGTWADETACIPVKVLIEGEPGFTQIRMAEKLARNEKLISYDFYFTNGQNIGDPACRVPTLGIQWKGMFHPVSLDLFPVAESRMQSSVTSILNWQSHQDVEYNGVVYGQKNREFLHFMDLPASVEVPLELALGKGGGVRTEDVPWKLLMENGWKIVNNREVTASFERFRNYISGSYAEFRVCKHLHIAMQTGWFSDVTACYMASGRPAIVQDTGYTSHLPIGRGLVAFKTREEACEAIKAIKSDYTMHSKAARDIAVEYFDAKKLMRSLTDHIN